MLFRILMISSIFFCVSVFSADFDIQNQEHQVRIVAGHLIHYTSYQIMQDNLDISSTWAWIHSTILTSALMTSLDYFAFRKNEMNRIDGGNSIATGLGIATSTVMIAVTLDF